MNPFRFPRGTIAKDERSTSNRGDASGRQSVSIDVNCDTRPACPRVSLEIGREPRRDRGLRAYSSRTKRKSVSIEQFYYFAAVCFDTRSLVETFSTVLHRLSQSSLAHIVRYFETLSSGKHLQLVSLRDHGPRWRTILVQTNDDRSPIVVPVDGMTVDPDPWRIRREIDLREE